MAARYVGGVRCSIPLAVHTNGQIVGNCAIRGLHFFILSIYFIYQRRIKLVKLNRTPSVFFSFREVKVITLDTITSGNSLKIDV